MFKKSTGEKSNYAEYDFVGSCLRMGISLSDLKDYTYREIVTIMSGFLKEPKKDDKPTQADIEKYFG